MRGEGRVKCPLDSSILFLFLYISYCKVEAAVSGVHCLSVCLSDQGVLLSCVCDDMEGQ